MPFNSGRRELTHNRRELGSIDIRKEGEGGEDEGGGQGDPKVGVFLVVFVCAE